MNRETNENIKKILNEIVVDYFNSSRNNFHDWLIDSFDSDIGTGKYLLNQVNDDISTRRNGVNTVSNLKDLELTRKVFKIHSKTYFIYSSGDSLGQPLTLQMVTKIAKGLGIGSPFKLFPSEVSARKSLEKLA